MSADVAAVLEAAESPPAAQRRELIELLAAGLDEVEPVISDELRAEPRRRLAAHEADPSRVLTWEQVEAFVRRDR